MTRMPYSKYLKYWKISLKEINATNIGKAVKLMGNSLGMAAEVYVVKGCLIVKGVTK